MRHVAVLMLALALTGCSAILPPSPTPMPTATPQVIVQTVLVTVIPTQGPTDTPAPTQTARIVVVTATSAASASPTASPAEGTPGTPTESPTVTPAPGSPTATLPADAGGGIFTNLTRSSDHFALRCQPDTITFGVSTSDTTIREVILFYRLENQSSGAISDWKNAGLMTSDGSGNYTIDFAAASVSPEIRSQKAWFDYQFVAVNKSGFVAGRSGKIVKQIAYSLDCGG